MGKSNYEFSSGKIEEKISISLSSASILNIFDACLDASISDTKDYDRKRDIIDRRFGLNGRPLATLEEIGLYHNLTRERIRQIEQTIIKNLDEILSGQRQPKKWNIWKDVIDEYTDLKGSLQERDQILHDSDLPDFFEQRYEMIIPGPLRNLLMEVLGFCNISQNIPGFSGNIVKAWAIKKEYSKGTKKRINDILKSLNVIYKTPAEKREIYSLVSIINKKSKLRVSEKELVNVLSVCKEIELTDDSARVKFQYLTNAADKSYRILESHGERMHYSEILREINHLQAKDDGKSISPQNLTNQMVVDKRFKTTTKTGIWGLSHWDGIPDMTIVETIEYVLTKENRPMKPDNIVSVAHKLRPGIKKSSIQTYLGTTEKFLKIDTGEYILADWNARSKYAVAERRKRTGNKRSAPLMDAVQATIRKTLAELTDHTITLTDLYKIVNRQAACIQPTFYAYLGRMSDVEKFKKGNTYYAMLRQKSKTTDVVERTVEQAGFDYLAMIDELRDYLTVNQLHDLSTAIQELKSILDNRNEPVLLGKMQRSFFNHIGVFIECELKKILEPVYRYVEANYVSVLSVWDDEARVERFKNTVLDEDQKTIGNSIILLTQLKNANKLAKFKSCVQAIKNSGAYTEVLANHYLRDRLNQVHKFRNHATHDSESVPNHRDMLIVADSLFEQGLLKKLVLANVRKPIIIKGESPNDTAKS